MIESCFSVCFGLRLARLSVSSFLPPKLDMGVRRKTPGGPAGASERGMMTIIRPGYNLTMPCFHGACRPFSGLAGFRGGLFLLTARLAGFCESLGPPTPGRKVPWAPRICRGDLGAMGPRPTAFLGRQSVRFIGGPGPALALICGDRGQNLPQSPLNVTFAKRYFLWPFRSYPQGFAGFFFDDRKRRNYFLFRESRPGASPESSRIEQGKTWPVPTA